MDLELGCLDPITEISGIQARLVNLGYQLEVTGEWNDESIEALKAFQHDREMTVTGELDAATRQELEEVYGF